MRTDRIRESMWARFQLAYITYSYHFPLLSVRCDYTLHFMVTVPVLGHWDSLQQRCNRNLFWDYDISEKFSSIMCVLKHSPIKMKLISTCDTLLWKPKLWLPRYGAETTEYVWMKLLSSISGNQISVLFGSFGGNWINNARSRVTMVA
jgi:hypothetical protein